MLSGLSALLLFAVAGCRSLRIEPLVRSPQTGLLTDSFKMYGQGATAPDRWWESLGSAELNRLVERSLDGNLTLSQARARLAQARALAVQRGAATKPQLDADGGSTQGRQRTAQSDGGSDDSSVESYFAGIVGSYELDLWGRLAAASRSSLLDADAVGEDLYTARISVAGEVALRWLELVQQRRKLALLDEQLRTNREVLELIELRLRRSQATALDLLQQKQVIAQVESLVPPEKSREETLLHELAVLLGLPPTAALKLEATHLPSLPPLPAAGVPADLLANRPDIRAAGLRLQSADWQVSAAQADRLPALRLTGTAKFSSPDLDRLFNNWLASLAASVTGPLFDGGQRKAEVVRTRALVDERLAAYRVTVLQAIQEVEDALSRERYQSEYVKALQMRLAAAQSTRSEASARYQKGLETYLPVLNALLEMQNIQRTLVEARQQELAYRVQLHRALGGVWPRNEGGER
jgi:NodT family efflux transporter outer membrane factor (OMF) lipoprotein